GAQRRAAGPADSHRALRFPRPRVRAPRTALPEPTGATSRDARLPAWCLHGYVCPAPVSATRPGGSGDVAAPLEHPLAGAAWCVDRAAARPVAAYLGAQADTLLAFRPRQIGDVQQQAGQRTAHQLDVRAPLARSGIVVVRPVDPAAHELQFVHTGRVASGT